MFTMNFLMYLGMGLGIFTAIGILIAGVSYLIQFIQHYKRLRVFVDEVTDWKNDLSHRIYNELVIPEEQPLANVIKGPLETDEHGQIFRRIIPSHDIEAVIAALGDAHPNYSTTSWCLKEFPKL